MNNLNKLIDFIKNKFSEEYTDVILLYLEHYYNYRLIDLDYPKGYITNVEVHNNKSNEKFNLILDTLNKIPFRLAAPIPPKYPKGIEITKAQGQEITKNVRAL